MIILALFVQLSYGQVICNDNARVGTFSVCLFCSYKSCFKNQHTLDDGSTNGKDWCACNEGYELKPGSSGASDSACGKCVGSCNHNSECLSGSCKGSCCDTSVIQECDQCGNNGECTSVTCNKEYYLSASGTSCTKCDSGMTSPLGSTSSSSCVYPSSSFSLSFILTLSVR